MKARSWFPFGFPSLLDDRREAGRTHDASRSPSPRCSPRRARQSKWRYWLGSNFVPVRTKGEGRSVRCGNAASQQRQPAEMLAPALVALGAWCRVLPVRAPDAIFTRWSSSGTSACSSSCPHSPHHAATRSRTGSCTRSDRGETGPGAGWIARPAGTRTRRASAADSVSTNCALRKDHAPTIERDTARSSEVVMLGGSVPR